MVQGTIISFGSRWPRDSLFKGSTQGEFWITSYTSCPSIFGTPNFLGCFLKKVRFFFSVFFSPVFFGEKRDGEAERTGEED